MLVYAIKIDGKYFKEYKYADISTKGRYAGHTALGSNLQDGDIVDVVLTKTIENTQSRRGLRDTISTLYEIEKIRNKAIEIIPVEG